MEEYFAAVKAVDATEKRWDALEVTHMRAWRQRVGVAGWCSISSSSLC